MFHDPQFWFAAIGAAAGLVFIIETLIRRWPF